ncbi:MAG: hypothetical protein M3Z06_12950, partial [Actinomycetota bacterium]|nr:hypothetical protein [Actinomycetota bacterium]
MRANADPRMLAERLLRGSELALEAARRDAADAMLACEELSERILALEAELVQARQEPERLQGLLASERRARRRAEQQAYAERARREELQQDLAAEREREQEDLDPDGRLEAEERRRELESEAAALRRQADELGHLVGAARRTRERAERRVAELTAAVERAELTAAHERAELTAALERAVLAAALQPVSAPNPAPTVSDGLAREFALA